MELVQIDWTGVTVRRSNYKAGAGIFAQGDACNSVLYIDQGSVRLSVVSHQGKEAVVAILAPGDFFGEGCLAGQPMRMSSAVALTPSGIIEIERQEFARQMVTRPALGQHFLRHMLTRNIRIEEDLIDQLFNDAEKRLARMLLLMARFGEERHPHRILPAVSQTILAEMIGTTRSRVNQFMTKFRKLGFIDYNGAIQVHHSLLTVLLREDRASTSGARSARAPRPSKSQS